ncbi:MAG TPA: histidine phosphatase family protein [Anaerolineales bacterium]|nr:histidine phosphatase family protein [Anaerolineales bacterium]
MRLYFIRHGQSENNALWVNNGSSADRSEDPELTELGHEQARRVADFVCSGYGEARLVEEEDQGFGITHLYSSLMVRAVATASYITRVTGTPLHAWADIHEEGGIYLDEGENNPVGRPGKTRSYFEQHYPHLHLPDWLDEEGWWRSRPYEQRDEMALRAGRFLGELLERHGGTEDRVAIVSHGGFYNQLLSRLLDRQPRNGLWFRMYNVGITCINFGPRYMDVIYQNRIDFLPPKMVT